MVRAELTEDEGGFCRVCKSEDVECIGNPQFQGRNVVVSSYRCNQCGHVGSETLKIDGPIIVVEASE